MSSLPLKRIRFAIAALLVAPLTLLGQAAVEYALRSAQSVPLDSSATIAGCSVNSALLMCLDHTYPRATLLVGAAVVGLVIVRALAPLFSRVR